MDNEVSNFITNKIDEDIESGKYRPEEIITRFPPEPNGYLHIGHVKAALLNYLTAKRYGGSFNLRFDDTNPVKEDEKYAKAIIDDLNWLGVISEDRIFYSSSYFEEMLKYAEELILKGLAYVDDQNSEEITKSRGTLVSAGTESPYRNRTPEENLALFREMAAGKVKPGSRVLRAKIDMSSPNMNMRDPILYRIIDKKHPNTDINWHVYPMYDFAHPLEDAIEGVTHSLCTLEFEDHRPLYDWVVTNIDDFKEKPPVQIEFAKLDIEDVIMGKRYLKELVDRKIVDGWDDPRLPTISGLRRKGITPEALKAFCEAIGIAKSNSKIDPRMLDHFIRNDLKLKTKRLNAVMDPLKLTITNYPEDEIEYLEIETNQDVEEFGKHLMPFGRELYIERSDFMENPPPKYFRLYPGNEVRLRGAYFVRCNEVIKDEEGNVTEIRCTYDPKTKSGTGFTGRKVKGTIHWVEKNNAVPIEVREYETLIKDEDFTPESFTEKLNPDSLKIKKALAEPEIRNVKPGEKVQFVRQGYYNYDPVSPGFNRIVNLKSSWKPPRKGKQ